MIYRALYAEYSDDPGEFGSRSGEEDNQRVPWMIALKSLLLIRNFTKSKRARSE